MQEGIRGWLVAGEGHLFADRPVLMCVGWKSWKIQEGIRGWLVAGEGCLRADRRVLMCGLEVLEEGRSGGLESGEGCLFGDESVLICVGWKSWRMQGVSGAG